MKTIPSNQFYNDPAHYDAQFREVESDITFYLEMAQKARGPVLELGCGTGRITIPLREAGIDITGLDISGAMLGFARKKARDKGLEIPLVRADCRNFSLDQKFALIFFPFNSMAHLHVIRDIEACFRCVKQHLADDGRFIVNVLNPDLELLTRAPGQHLLVSNYPDPGGRGMVHIMETSSYDLATQVLKLKWHYSMDDPEAGYVKELDMRIFFPEELETLLFVNGFSILKRFGDFMKTPFSSRSLEQTLVCQLKRE